MSAVVHQRGRRAFVYGRNRGIAVRLTIEKVVYGGAGLARHDGRVWLVPLCAPGEVIEAEPVADRKNRIEGRLVSVIEPSADRREAPCPYYSECGGCQLQHVNYAAQSRVRRGFVSEALQKERVVFGGDVEFVPSPFELGYRNRAQPAVANGRMGCLKRRSHEIVEVEHCPLCLPEISAAVPKLREHVRAGGENAAPLGKIFVACGENGRVAAEPSPDPGWPHEVRWTVGGVTFWCRPEVFFQANAHLLDSFQSVVCESLSGRTVLDLFGGTGFFSIPLARSFKSVTVVEEDRAAVALGKRNAKEAGAGNVRFVASRVEDLDPESLESPGSGADVVLIDPPRAGLSNRAFEMVVSLAPSAAVYVSCDPNSMARDIRKLVSAGFRLDRVVILDLFPQTFHVETVAFVSRRSLGFGVRSAGSRHLPRPSTGPRMAGADRWSVKASGAGGARFQCAAGTGFLGEKAGAPDSRPQSRRLTSSPIGRTLRTPAPRAICARRKLS